MVYALWTVMAFAGNFSAMWDFRMYYACAQAFAHGIDPYDAQIMHDVYSVPVALPFSYPPVMMMFFGLFSWMGISGAVVAYAAVSALCAAALLILWKRAFLTGTSQVLFALVCLFGFNAAIFSGLRAGNIVIFEQLILWTGLYLFTEKRYLPAALLIACAAVPKIQPIFFLLLFALRPGRDKIIALAAGCALYAGVTVFQLVTTPHLFGAFLGNAFSILREAGIINPSSYAFSGDAAALLSKWAGSSSAPVWAGRALYGVMAGVVVLFSARALKTLIAVHPEKSETWIVCLACLVFALIAPRFKDYSYALLIVPLCFVIQRAGSFDGAWVLAAASMLTIYRGPLPGSGDVLALLWPYQPLIMAYAVWVLFLRQIGRLAAGAPPAQIAEARA